jgi:putative transposase
VSPERRRRTAIEVRRRLGPDQVSERRVCRVLGQSRSTQRYARRRRGDEARLLEEMRRIARRRPRFGSPRIHVALQQCGWRVNHKRVERLWREEGMQVPKKQCKQRRSSACGGSENSCVRKRPLRPNHVWSYDFVEDRTERGRKLRMLVVIDEFTRESLAIELAWSFTAERVIEVLQYLFAVRGAPEYLRSDNGPEFVAQAVTRWLDRAGVKTLFIAKGSPWENGYVESFNSRLRDELLDRELFLSLADARWVVDRWRLDYNHHRPHSSLDYQTPAAFAARCAASAPERASATPQLSPPLQQHSGPLTPDSLIHTGT